MAFHEIAVEPTVIRSWRDFQMIWGMVGFGKGRLIASFPEKGPENEKHQSWAWRVVESVKVCEPGSAKKVSACLETQAKLKLLKNKRPFDHGRQWSANAGIEHRRSPFSAIIEEGAVCDSHRCTLDDLGDENGPSCLKNDQHVMTFPKRPGLFTDALLPILRCAKVLKFVDPYFLKTSEDESGPYFSIKHGKVVEEIARKLEEFGRVPQSVEFHMLALSGDEATQLEVFCKGMNAHLPKCWKAKAFIWREDGARRFHARYVLTDVGGAGSEYGLDQGKSAHDQTDLYLLPETTLSTLNQEFSASGKVFTLAAGPGEFSGTRG